MSNVALTNEPPQLSSVDDPAALIEWLRRTSAETPVVYDEKTQLCQVFRHADIMSVAGDWATFSSDDRHLVPQNEGFRVFTKGNLASLDPPRHRQLKNLVTKVFTPRVVAKLEPRVQELVDDQLNHFDGDEVDLVSGLTNPIPALVIAELLGIPVDDREQFQHWAFEMVGIGGEVDVTDPDAAEKVLADLSRIMTEMNAFAFDQIARHRAHPRDDLITSLVDAEVDGMRLDDEEIAGFVLLLFLAGHVTTTLTLGSLLLCLDDNPTAATAVRTNPDLIPGAIEETMRQRPPFPTSKRLVTRDTEIGGVPVPEGAGVVLWLAAGNHDPDVFDDPGTFDVARSRNSHLGFGAGIHFCLGAGLARLEARVVLRTLLDRFPDLRVDRPEVRFYGSTSIVGPKYLPVRLR
jgi:cytochrome P450